MNHQNKQMKYVLIVLRSDVKAVKEKFQVKVNSFNEF